MGMKYLVMLDRKEDFSSRSEKDRAEAEDSKLAWHKLDGSETHKQVF